MKIKLLVAGGFLIAFSLADLATKANAEQRPPATVEYKTVKVDGLDIFYREAGNPLNPTILLLHGFPSSSHMFQDLINDLSGDYHLIAPDYPGFGSSSCPPPDEFAYTFDHLSAVMLDFIDKIGLKKYALYMQDYGGPIGFRIASRRPEQIHALLIQNANAYQEGLGTGFKKIMDLEDHGDTATVRTILEHIISFDGIKMQYTDGAKYQTHVTPDAFYLDFSLVARPGNTTIQNALFQNYHLNLKQYPAWQQYFRTYEPPVLIVWGKNDAIFTAAGAMAYQQDLKHVELHLLDGGHFALVEYHREIAAYIRIFLSALSIRLQ